MTHWVHPINKAAERIDQLQQRTHELEQENAKLKRVAEAAQEAYDLGFVTQRLGTALAAAGMEIVR